MDYFLKNDNHSFALFGRVLVTTSLLDYLIELQYHLSFGLFDGVAVTTSLYERESVKSTCVGLLSFNHADSSRQCR